MYCGDETGSFIGDVGSSVCRFGYGGEDNPKLVVSSYVDRVQRRMAAGSSLRYRSPPTGPSSSSTSTSSSSMESILRMPKPQDDNGNGNDAPWTDPGAFLRQGDSIEHWDALEVAWETSMDTLRARDTRKHTVGGTPYNNNNNSSSTAAASGLKSTTVKASKSVGNEGGQCIHPILAVMPGMTEYDGCGRAYHDARRREQYEKYTELLMEGGAISATSCFLAPAPMLAAFSLGRQTALMVDVGAGGCRVTPVCDGLVLGHSQRRNGRGGDWLGHVTWKALMEQHKREPTPRYVLSRREPTVATTTTTGRTSKSSSRASSGGGAHKATKSSTIPSPPAPAPAPAAFHTRAMCDLMYEIRTEPFVALKVSSEEARVPFVKPDDDDDDEGDDDDNDDEDDPMEGILPGSDTGAGGPTTYQLPDGTPINLSTPLGQDLKQIPELLFAETSSLPFGGTSSATNNLSTLSSAPLHQLVHQSLLSVGDVDLRKELAQAICLTGGTSLFPNLEARLSHELTQILPSFVKPKVVASRFSVERSCASWIGASILTSLGSFQQLWLSKAEYDEYGCHNAIQRFP